MARSRFSSGDGHPLSREAAPHGFGRVTSTTRSSCARAPTDYRQPSCSLVRDYRCWFGKVSPTIGGGARSAELTLPGFVHDVCSAIHPMAAVSPFFSALPLESMD